MISRKNDKAEKKKERDDSEDFHVEEVIDRPFSKALAGRLLHYLKPYRLLVASSCQYRPFSHRTFVDQRSGGRPLGSPCTRD